MSLFRKHCYNARPRAPRSLPTSPVERVARPLPLASRWSPVDRQSWASGRARSAQTRPSPAAATRTAHRGCAPSALRAAPCHCSCANRRHSIIQDSRRLPACRQPTVLVDPYPAEHTVEPPLEWLRSHLWQSVARISSGRRGCERLSRTGTRETDHAQSVSAPDSLL